MNPINEFAFKEMWTNLKQDFQFIVKPARVSQEYGAFKTVRYSTKEYQLPDSDHRWHVYTYNLCMADRLNIRLKITGNWYKLTDLMEEQGFLFDVYTIEGYMIAKDDLYIQQVNNGLLLIAIKNRTNTGFKLGTDDIYCRSYFNAWFELSTYKEKILVRHFEVPNLQTALVAKSYIESTKTLPGLTWVICNGFYFDADKWDAYSTKENDWVEVITDTSVKLTVDYPLENPKFYTSTLDKKQKYLLHHNFNTDEVLHFMDVDFYLQHKNGAGLYLHRNDPTTVRMLTHKDYGFAVDNVAKTKESQLNWFNTDLLSIKAIIRNSGTKRNLIFESNRIKELYKLSDYEIVKSIHGILANLPEWHVSNLEKSFWTEIMENQSTCFNLDKIVAALGYNAITKYLADTPNKVTDVNGIRGVRLPVIQQGGCTVFEYDENGLLLNNRVVGAARNYYCKLNNAALVEEIPNLSSETLTEIYGGVEIVIPPNTNYRCYIAKRVNDEITPGTWADVTGTSHYKLNTNSKGEKVISWNINNELLTLVRFDTANLLYSTTINFSDGVFDFDISSIYKLPWQIAPFKQIQLVPMGQYDVYLNKHLLAEGIDYIIDFPKVVIINKKYIDKNNQQQSITVRGVGFCNKELKPIVIRESGFVIDGKLSTNNTHNVRDDIVTRFSVDGRVIHRDDLVFDEDTKTFVDNNLNGLPYMASELLIPLNKELINTDYINLREKSRDLDRRIEKYMSGIMPRDAGETHVIGAHYPLYSPLVFSIIMDILTERIPKETVRMPLVDMRLLNATNSNYAQWFKYDPVNPNLGLSEKVVMVHPHPFETTIWLDLYQYRFVKRVTDLYTRGRVVLSHFVQFKD